MLNLRTGLRIVGEVLDFPNRIGSNQQFTMPYEDGPKRDALYQLENKKTKPLFMALSSALILTSFVSAVTAIVFSNPLLLLGLAAFPAVMKGEAYLYRVAKTAALLSDKKYKPKVAEIFKARLHRIRNRAQKKESMKSVAHITDLAIEYAACCPELRQNQTGLEIRRQEMKVHRLEQNGRNAETGRRLRVLRGIKRRDQRRLNRMAEVASLCR